MKQIKPTNIIFLAMFFFSFLVAITAYLNSSFAENLGLSQTGISLVYIASALIALAGLFTVPHLIVRIGNRKALIAMLGIIALCLLSFVLFQSQLALILFLPVYIGIQFVVFFELDVFLEHYSSEKLTGRIRGIFLTILNTAWALAPLLAGYILDQFGFQSVYIIGLAGALVVLSIFLLSFKNQSMNKAHIQTPREAFDLISQNKDMFGVFTISTLLQFFYAIMIIFSPLYLSMVIGFSWTEIGVMFMLMHIPFIILEYPLGRLADTRIGEKEIIITGLIITAIGCFLFLSTQEPNIIIWAGILIFSRIGASFLETGSESYFFKKVTNKDIEVISAFRSAGPVAIILGSLTGFIVSAFSLNFVILFATMGVLLLLGIIPALRIADTL